MKYIPIFFLCIVVVLACKIYAAEDFIVTPKKKRVPKITNEQLCNQNDELMHRFSNVLPLMGQIQKKILRTTRALLEGDKNNPIVTAKKKERAQYAQKRAQLLHQVRMFEKQLKAYVSSE